MLSRVAPEIPVLDMKESLDYYREKLGFRTAMVMPDGDYAIVERDAVAIHLFTELAESISPAGVHIFTSELDAFYAECTRRGAKITSNIVTQPWGNRDFRITDPSGNVLKLTEPTGGDR